MLPPSHIIEGPGFPWPLPPLPTPMNLHYDGVHEDVLRQPHGTTPAAVKIK